MTTKFPIMLTPTSRIDEGDKHQYFIQHLGTVKGKEAWKNVKFCGSLSGLVCASRDIVGAFYENIARQKFNDAGLPELIMNLPKKDGK